VVIAPGHRPAQATWTGQDTLVVPLEPAPRIRVRLPVRADIDTVALRGDPERQLANVGDSDLGALDGWPGMTPRAPRDGVAAFVVPEPGRYHIELTGADAGVLGPLVVDVGPEQTVETVLSR
jgi:hypothetical protein